MDPVTHTPVEEKEKVEEKIETNPEPNALKEQEETRGKENEAKMGLDGRNDLLNGYEALCWSSDVGLWWNQETTNSNSQSLSLSLEDSLNPSMGESLSMKEDSIQKWVDSVDSMLSWDGFNQLEEELLFLENFQ